MVTYTERALSQLKAKGYRMTKPRRLVIEVLEHATESLSPYDIKARLEQHGERVDTVSIYRIIECLEKHKLAHRLLLQYGKVLKCQLEDESCCHRHQADHCHHFLICEQCGKIEEMHCVGLGPVADQVTRQSGFQVKSHHLEFVGLCLSCATANK